MVKLENTLMIIFMLFTIGFSTFMGSLGISSSANDTNTTNMTTESNIAKLASSPSVTAVADPTPSTTGTSPSVSISVNSQVNLGNVIADGSEYSYPSATQVNASASEITYIWDSNNDKLNLYVKASGDLTRSSDNIPLSNLKYNGFSNSKTSFTTDYVKIESWTFSPSWVFLLRYNWTASGNVSGNYYLTVPTGVSPGTYKTTVYYLAMIQQQ